MEAPSAVLETSVASDSDSFSAGGTTSTGASVSSEERSLAVGAAVVYEVKNTRC